MRVFKVLPPRPPVIKPHQSRIHFAEFPEPGRLGVGPQFYARVFKSDGSMFIREYDHREEWLEAKMHSDFSHSKKHMIIGKQEKCQCTFCRTH